MAGKDWNRGARSAASGLGCQYSDRALKVTAMKDPIFNKTIKDPFLRACMKGDAAELQRLLEQGPKPDDLIPLAVDGIKKPQVLEVLLKHGLDPNAHFNEYQESLLSRAITKG